MNDHDYGHPYADKSAYTAQRYGSYVQERDRPSEGYSESNVERIGSLRGVSEVIVMTPATFEEISRVIEALRSYKSVVINLSSMDLETAQRAIDFVSGGTYAMDGNQEQIGETIFLFTPNSIKINPLRLGYPPASQTAPATPIPPLLYPR